jgi:hypothetical protein
LGRPPQTGDSVTSPDSHQVVFTVLDVDGLAVARARVEYPVHEDETEEEAEPAE